jgi:nucleotide-binding universal stress UspA family protein
VNDEQDSLYPAEPHIDPESIRGPRVVVAVDGSEGSKAAVKYALEDAARREVPVVAIIAYRPPEYWLDFNAVGAAEEERLLRELSRDQEARARAVVDEVVADLPGPLPQVHVRALMGAPADVLVRESDGADLLVLGSRGHGGFHTMLLGSTSMQCTMHAVCPVTVVHSPEAHHHRLRLHRERREPRRRSATANAH